ncbi:DUF1801 domain-containing protein [Emticicia agri]|uniref:DUF1801 domain-containing protein n=1 Tax=Emticicia agri TaxID=2492393 RepID=A0A4Q5M5W0_9BACT|nr:DUF1801 domain-containing protein [Emticicia agri]RYU97569.1 DUF1801 domain-containing protein [Emticicia agri]
MLYPIDNYFEQQNEPTRSCLLFLRSSILKHDPDITETWKYKMPVYCYKGKMLCYLWIHKKYKSNGVPLPYMGIIDGNRIDEPDLIKEDRARMKILLIDPHEDIAVERIDRLLTMMLQLRQSL